MSLQDELTEAVEGIFESRWDVRDGQKVPEAEDLLLGNSGVQLDATVLYADLSGSTRMVDAKTAEFAAEVYKTYLHCAATLVRKLGGVITAYDGDRIMGVFIGDSKNTSAVQCGLGVNWAVTHIVNPALKAQYPKSDFQVQHVVGIDTSSLMAARTGVRGANDLVWVGRAANYAAKLTELDSGYPTWITHRVFDSMNKSVKVWRDGREMWEARTWIDMSNLSIYRSNWWVRPNV